MKKIIFTSLAALTIITSQAGFIIKIPLEQTQGGALPDGSINITHRTPGLPVENWQPAEPLYGEWINVGESYDCLNISLDDSSSTTGRNFVQRETGCKQAQNRTRQDREQETTTLVLRDIGEPVLEDRLTNNAIAQKTTNLLLPANCYFEAGTNNTFVRQYYNEPFEARDYQTTFYMDFWGQSMFTSEQGEFLTETPKMSDSKIYSRGPLVRTTIDLRGTAKSGIILYSICRN